MSDGDDTRTIAWRVRTLEQIQRAQAVELADLREKAAEAPTVFVTREESERAGARRREWPLILFSGVMTLTGVVNLILIAGGH